MIDLGIDLCGVKLKNPVMVCSGTFGSGAEYSEFVDLNRLGAVVTKGVAVTPWTGNPAPRIAETPSGMLNAIGLQNPGIDVFEERDLPYLAQFDTRVIVNVCGHSEEEYIACVKRLSENDTVDMLEINISCPNVREGGIAFGTDPKAVFAITNAIKKVSAKPVIMKLSPNVTITGMKIDVERQCFALANRTGGLSGPAIRPVAVRMVYQAAHAVSVPVIGMGGITCASDALEFILAGASAVSIGTANFHNPCTAAEVVDGIADYMERHHTDHVQSLVGAVK